MHGLLFRAEYKPRGYYLEHFWQADLGYIGQAIIGVKVPNSSHVACIQHGRVIIMIITRLANIFVLSRLCKHM